MKVATAARPPLTPSGVPGPCPPGPPAFVFPPPAPGDNLGKDLLWGRKLGAAAHRVHRLSARLYYLSSVGGGWAAVRRADMPRGPHPPPTAFGSG